MSLLNNTKPVQPVVAEKAPVAETVAAEGKKKHSNSEYQKKQRELTRQHGKTVLEFIKTLKAVPADVKEAAEWLGRDVGTRAASGMHASAFGKPVFYRIFGDAPKIGDSVTALDVFNKTDKGYSDMRSLMKKWSEKQGIKVEFDEKAKTYTIKEGKIPAYQA